MAGQGIAPRVERGGRGTGGAALARRVAGGAIRERRQGWPREAAPTGLATGGCPTFIKWSLKPNISLSADESTEPASRSAAIFSSVYGVTNLESIFDWQSAIVLARVSEDSAGAHIVRRPAARRASDTPRLASMFCVGVGAGGVREQKWALGLVYGGE